MTRRRGWEIDDPTREAWARALRGAVATLEVTEAPRGWKGWSLAAERLKDPYKMSVFLWEPGAPRPEGLAVATPGLTPTILLILGRFLVPTWSGVETSEHPTCERTSKRL